MHRPFFGATVVALGLGLWVTPTGAQELGAQEETRILQCPPPAENEAAKLHARAMQLGEHPTLRDMLEKNNQLRDARGLPPLRISARLSAAAQNHANYMARTRSFSHYCNGDPGCRAALYGYRCGVRENIAFGQPNPQNVFAVWAASDKHYVNLMSQSDLAGFGYARAENGQIYWVAMYGPKDRLE